MMDVAWDPLRGRDYLRQLCMNIIRARGGSLPVEDLLAFLKTEGYLKEPLRELLPTLGIYTDESGVCRLRAMKNV